MPPEVPEDAVELAVGAVPPAPTVTVTEVISVRSTNASALPPPPPPPPPLVLPPEPPPPITVTLAFRPFFRT